MYENAYEGNSCIENLVNERKKRDLQYSTTITCI